MSKHTLIVQSADQISILALFTEFNPLTVPASILLLPSLLRKYLCFGVVLEAIQKRNASVLIHSSADLKKAYSISQLNI